jgi:hypothetical protein
VFELYVAECARHLVNNVGEALGGSIVKTSFNDIINPHIPTETADEIKARIKKGLEELNQ